jgi:hypothetical protein
VASTGLRDGGTRDGGSRGQFKVMSPLESFLFILYGRI